MRQERALLRRLLSALLAERQDTDSLYIPRGAEGQRRMILHLLAMRPPKAVPMQTEEDIRAFLELEEQHAPAADMPQQRTE